MKQDPHGGWDTVVHLGAGDGRTWPSLGARTARHRVLVEGDGDTAARLRVAMRGQADITLVERVVGPVGGKGTWFSHNVRGFDGLFRHDAGAMAHRYPRLRCTGQRSVAVQALNAVLDEGLAGRGADGPHALVIDLPWPGFAWAAADAARSFGRFDEIVVTTAAWSVDGPAVPTELQDALATAGFVECRDAGPVGGARFGRDGSLWRARIATLEAEVRRLRERQAAGDQQRAEMRLAIARADGALRALDPLLRPEGGGPTP